MKNGTGIQSMIIIVLSVILSIICPGCKPGVKDENTITISVHPTPARGDHFLKKSIIPHKAKFSRKWED
jgi:hypothetical protein